MKKVLLHISFTELCQDEFIEGEHIVELVDHGVITPAAGTGQDDWIFDTRSVYWIKKALKLRRDLDLEWLAVALAIDLIRENEILRDEIESCKRQLQRFLEHH